MSTWPCTSVSCRKFKHVHVLDFNFCLILDKPNCRPCDEILEQLENIDDECDAYGIQMVKIHDSTVAKRYSIKTYPALVYFRNGNPLLFDGDLMVEEDVFQWMIEDENRELADEIEEVNLKMLNRLLDDCPFLAVFYCNFFTYITGPFFKSI